MLPCLKRSWTFTATWSAGGDSVRWGHRVQGKAGRGGWQGGRRGARGQGGLELGLLGPNSSPIIAPNRPSNTEPEAERGDPPVCEWGPIEAASLTCTQAQPGLLPTIRSWLRCQLPGWGSHCSPGLCASGSLSVPACTEGLSVWGRAPARSPPHHCVVPAFTASHPPWPRTLRGQRFSTCPGTYLGPSLWGQLHLSQAG